MAIDVMYSIHLTSFVNKILTFFRIGEFVFPGSFDIIGYCILTLIKVAHIEMPSEYFSLMSDLLEEGVYYPDPSGEIGYFL